MNNKEIANATLANDFLQKSQELNKGRLARFLRAPLKLLTIRLYQKINVTKEHIVNLSFGKLKFHGIIPEAVSSAIWRFHFFDPKTSFMVAKSLPEGSVFLDIGAHFGYFSLLAGACVGSKGRIISIEAMPSTYDYLCNNINKNKLQEICTTYNIAAYNEISELTFSDFGVVNSSLNSAFGNRSTSSDVEEVRSVKIAAKPIDNLVNELGLNRVDLIKIDAESSEYFVILGLIETLKKFKPRVIVELGDHGVTGAQKTTRDIIDLMKACGYKCLIIDNLGNFQEIELKERYDYCNVLFEHPKK